MMLPSPIKNQGGRASRAPWEYYIRMRLGSGRRAPRRFQAISSSKTLR